MFKAYEPGYLHVDVKYLPQMADETTRRLSANAVIRLPANGLLRNHLSRLARAGQRIVSVIQFSDGVREALDGWKIPCNGD